MQQDNQLSRVSVRVNCPHGCRRHVHPMPSYDVTYEITSGIDNHHTAVHCDTVNVTATSPSHAAQKARALAENTTHYDPRIDPRATIRSVHPAGE